MVFMQGREGLYLGVFLRLVKQRVTQNLMELSDERLMAQIQSGDEDAIDAVIVKYEQLLRVIIDGKGITHPDDANDVFGDICLAFVKQVRKDPTAIREVDKWLKQVARNKCADFGRAAQKQQHAVALAADIQRTAAEQSRRGRAGGSRGEAAMMFLEGLDAKYVDVLKLWEAGYTSAEIGERLGIPENTVKSRKTTIRKRLSEALREFSPPEK